MWLCVKAREVSCCRPVVVLAERDKDDMDAQLKQALRAHKIEWHTRSGAPHSIADLEKVAAGQARTIIILQPEEEEVRGPRSLLFYRVPDVPPGALS